MTEIWQLHHYLQERIKLVESALDHYLPAGDCLPAAVHEAMRYSIFAGGKRIRPILLLAASDAVRGELSRALPAAVALEMVHCYSLIHDDLPAMDDDDLRRGKPTCHKVFGEATAILAGDALLTEAFSLLSHPDMCRDIPAHQHCEIIHVLAKSAGSRGMVGGQIVDMESEDKAIDLPTLEYIHTHKTGALLLAAIEIGALLGGASSTQKQALCRYGQAAGLAFQIADDILDVIGNQVELGKTIGSDEQRGKATYPALLGLTEARGRAWELRQVALDALTDFGDEARPLRELASYIVERSF